MGRRKQEQEDRDGLALVFEWAMRDQTECLSSGDPEAEEEARANLVGMEGLRQRLITRGLLMPCDPDNTPEVNAK
jgi:hypothetical protein